MQQLQQEVAPKRLSAHGDAISLDERLFARVKAVYEERATLALDAESLRLLEISYDGFVKSGALLSRRRTRTRCVRGTRSSPRCR